MNSMGVCIRTTLLNDDKCKGRNKTGEGRKPFRSGKPESAWFGDVNHHNRWFFAQLCFWLFVNTKTRQVRLFRAHSFRWRNIATCLLHVLHWLRVLFALVCDISWPNIANQARIPVQCRLHHSTHLEVLLANRLNQCPFFALQKPFFPLVQVAWGLLSFWFVVFDLLLLFQLLIYFCFRTPDDMDL